MHYDDFRSLCQERRSIRFFADTPVTKEEITKLLELARLAPSIQNLQPWRFHVILNGDLRSQLAKYCCYGNFVDDGGALIVVTCDHGLERQSPEVIWHPKELEFSCMTAAEHVLLGATAMGLGSCWVSLLHGEPHHLLKLPHREVVIGGILIGHYRSGEEHPSGEHDRRPLSEMCVFHE